MKNTITPAQALAWLSSGDAILIDVREPDEFKAEHIAYALSVPLGQLQETLPTLGLPADKKILFHCLKGKRGEQACILAGQSRNCPHETYNIEGGIEGWKNANLAVIGSASSKISIFRQVQMIVGGLIAILVLLGFQGMAPAFALAGIFGGALFFAGLTGWCGLAMILSKIPWNK